MVIYNLPVIDHQIKSITLTGGIKLNLLKRAICLDECLVFTGINYWVCVCDGGDYLLFSRLYLVANWPVLEWTSSIKRPGHGSLIPKRTDLSFVCPGLSESCRVLP